MPIDSVQTVLTKFNIDSTQAQASATQLLGTVTKLDKTMKTVVSTYKTANGTLIAHSKTMYASADAAAKAGKNIGDVAKETAKVTKVTDEARRKGGLFGTGDSAKTILSKVASWTLATGAIFGTIGALRKGIATMTEFDSGMVGLRKVFQGTEDELRILKTDILDTSVEMGSLTDATVKAAVELGRMGKTRAEISELLRVSLLAQNIAEIDAADATKFLNAAILQFNKSADEAIEILDKWNTLSNRTPVETRAMAEAVSIAGAVFNQAGAELEDLNAFVATLTATMAKNGREIGNALKTIASYAFRQKTVKKIVELTGIAVEDQNGKLLELDVLLARLSARWSTLTTAQQEELAQSVAGVRRKGFFLNLMENFNMTIENQALQWDSAGSSMQENEIRLESLATKVLQLQAALEKLAVQTGDSGVLGGLKIMTDQLRIFVDNIAEANTMMTLFSGAAAISLVRSLGASRVAFVASAKAAGTFTTSLRILNSAIFKWTAAITIGIAVFNGLIWAFSRNERQLKKRSELLAKDIALLKKQKSELNSIIDGYKLLNATYQEYQKLRDEGRDTEEIEERLELILQKLNETFPEVIQGADDWSTALTKMKGAADAAGLAINDLNKQSIQFGIDTDEALLRAKKAELITKRDTTVGTTMGLFRSFDPGRTMALVDAQIEGLTALEKLYEEWSIQVDGLSEKEEDRRRTQRQALAELIVLQKEIIALEQKIADARDREINFDKYLKAASEAQERIDKASKKGIDARIKAIKEEINLLEGTTRTDELDRLKGQLTLAKQMRAGIRAREVAEAEELQKLREQFEMVKARIEGEEAVLALLLERQEAMDEEHDKSKIQFKIDEQRLNIAESQRKEQEKIFKLRKRQAEQEEKLFMRQEAQFLEIKSQGGLIGASPGQRIRNIERRARAGEIDLGEAVIEIAQIKLDEKVLKFDLADSISTAVGDALEDAVYMAVEGGFTRLERNRPWNSLLRSLGSDIGNIVGTSIQGSIQKKLSPEGEALSLGGSILSVVSGNIIGSLVSTAFSALAAIFFPTEEPEKEEALVENTQSIRELTDEMRKFNERYINAPATFALGATSGEIPQAAGGARLLTPGYVYGHAGEIIAQPDQFQYLTKNNNFYNSVGDIKIYPQPNQNPDEIADSVMKKISNRYDRGGQYNSKI